MNIPGSPAAPAAPALPVGATAAVEDAPVNTEAAPPEEKKELLSPRFAALAKREKAIAKQREELMRMQAEIQPAKEKLSQFEQLKADAKKNPMKYLQELGWTYQDLTNLILNEEKPTPELEVKSVREELEQFKKEQQEAKDRDEAKQKRQQEEAYEKVKVDFKNEIKELLTAKPEDFEFSSLEDPDEFADLVYATIEGHYEETKAAGKPRIMSKEEAAKLVEDHFEERVSGYTKTKKFQSKFANPAPEIKDPPPPSKTLASSLTSSPASPRAPARTDQERIQRALAALDRK